MWPRHRWRRARDGNGGTHPGGFFEQSAALTGPEGGVLSVGEKMSKTASGGTSEEAEEHELREVGQGAEEKMAKVDEENVIGLA